MSRWLVLFAIVGRVVSAQSLPLGQIVDDVQCKADASQRYSLYLPSHFTPVRKWSVILAYDAGGRGRRAVERYQAAAEKYGYIIAGSNNSRNGPWEVSLNAAKAMTADVEQRFPVDPKRIYTAGMSGGARVAMKLAMDSESIAGVFASSAAFPDDPRDEVRFPIFGSAGTDDFNHQEMHELDRDLKSPHRIEVFDGGHAWLPVELAMDGVEWMEIQAMKAGLRDRDAKEIDEIFAKRVARAEGQARSVDKMRELRSIAVDFQGMKDVGKFAERAAALERQADVKEALKAERAEEERELQTTAEVYQLRDRMNNAGGFPKLKARVTQLLEQSKSAQDSTDRRIARRVLTGLGASSRSIHNPEFQELLNQIRPPGAPGAALVCMQYSASRKKVRLFVVAGILTLSSAGLVFEKIGQREDHQRFRQIGRSVDIGGRTLNIFCSGESGPAVVFDTYGHMSGYSWSAVQSDVAKFSRACWYDRAAYGWSDPASMPRTFRSVASDLHELLHAAAVPPPYVFVGGGDAALHIRVYHGLYPSEVAGVVMVNANDSYDPQPEIPAPAKGASG